MSARERYATPAAFRRALTDRLKDTSKRSNWTIQQLQRQVAYDRLLERLYIVDDGWIVKGATALLARDLGVRGSLDVDVYRAVAQNVAEADLRRAAEIDLGDWFLFTVGAAAPIGNNSLRFPVVAIMGTTTWVSRGLVRHRSPFDGASRRCACDRPRVNTFCRTKGIPRVPTGGPRRRQSGRNLRATRRIGESINSLPRSRGPRSNCYGRVNRRTISEQRPSFRI